MDGEWMGLGGMMGKTQNKEKIFPPDFLNHGVGFTPIHAHKFYLALIDAKH